MTNKTEETKWNKSKKGNFLFYPQVYEAMTAAAAEKGISMNEWVNRLIMRELGIADPNADLETLREQNELQQRMIREQKRMLEEKRAMMQKNLHMLREYEALLACRAEEFQQRIAYMEQTDGIADAAEQERSRQEVARLETECKVLQKKAYELKYEIDMMQGTDCIF